MLMPWDQLRSWEGPIYQLPPSLGIHATQPGVGCRILCTTLPRPDPEGHGLLTPDPLFLPPTLQDSLDQRVPHTLTLNAIPVEPNAILVSHHLVLF